MGNFSCKPPLESRPGTPVANIHLLQFPDEVNHRLKATQTGTCSNRPTTDHAECRDFGVRRGPLREGEANESRKENVHGRAGADSDCAASSMRSGGKVSDSNSTAPSEWLIALLCRLASSEAEDHQANFSNRPPGQLSILRCLHTPYPRRWLSESD